MKKIMLLLLMSSSFSCSDDEIRVDTILLPYFNDFLDEAAKRNEQYSISGLKIELADIQEQGLCTRHKKLIQLKRDFVLSTIGKDAANDNWVKLTLFHELGHFMGRDHTSGLSIMNSGDPFEGKGDFIGTLQFYNAHPESRMGIINELFE